MVTYILHGENMHSREAAHDELAHALKLPEYYGRNLDALWDMLSEMQGQILLTKKDAMLDGLGVYGEKLYRLLCEAAVRNPNLEFICEG